MLQLPVAEFSVTALPHTSSGVWVGIAESMLQTALNNLLIRQTIQRQGIRYACIAVQQIVNGNLVLRGKFYNHMQRRELSTAFIQPYHADGNSYQFSNLFSRKITFYTQSL